MRRVGAVLVALSLLAGGSARAQEAPRHEPSAGDLATARTALKDGLALREKGDLEGALARLTTAWDLVQTPVTGFELGKAHMMLGHVMQAHEMFRRVERMPQSLEESSRSAAAREEAARLATDLEPRIPSLRIQVKLPTGATAVVRVDDDVITMTGPVTPRAVDPGTHEVSARAGEGPEEKLTVEIKEGETRDVELAPQWVPPKPAPKPEPVKQVVIVRQTNPLVFVGYGLSSVSVALSGLSVFMAANAASSVRDACATSYCPPAADSDKTMFRRWVAVGAIAGAASIGFLVMGVIASSHPVEEKLTAGERVRVRVHVGLGSAAIEGRFQ
jgi:hypothetical protein